MDRPTERRQVHPSEGGGRFGETGLAESFAVRKHDRISQVGTQIHASENYRRVVELIRSGNLGPVGVVRTFNVLNQMPDGVGHSPATPIPAGLDWELWCGPAPLHPFNPILAH